MRQGKRRVDEAFFGADDALRERGRRARPKGVSRAAFGVRTGGYRGRFPLGRKGAEACFRAGPAGRGQITKSACGGGFELLRKLFKGIAKGDEKTSPNATPNTARNAVRRSIDHGRSTFPERISIEARTREKALPARHEKGAENGVGRLRRGARGRSAQESPSRSGRGQMPQEMHSEPSGRASADGLRAGSGYEEEDDLARRMRPLRQDRNAEGFGCVRFAFETFRRCRAEGRTRDRNSFGGKHKSLENTTIFGSFGEFIPTSFMPRSGPRGWADGLFDDCGEPDRSRKAVFRAWRLCRLLAVRPGPLPRCGSMFRV